MFQLESAGMTSLMKDLRCNCLEDIMVGIALYRPGPMESIPRYIKSKNNSAKITYTHPSLKPILSETYGCIVYQEHVMQIVRDLAGYSMSRSDMVRRAMSKKKADVMAQERHNFIHGLEDANVPGCVKNGIPAATAGKIYDEMVTFAQYGFNKAHAAAYAFISYQTAWLKVYYPVEFMAAIMTSVMDFTAKVAEYIYECKKMNITLLPPDINEGYAFFSVAGDSIRFGLSAIKNVGRGAVDSIVKERELNGKYKGLTDFIQRLESKDINKRCMESLIKAGAFDSLGGKRSQYMAVYGVVMNGMSMVRKKTLEGQMNLFDMEGEEAAPVTDELPPLAELPARLMLNNEKEVLGVYVSGHPLSDYEEALHLYTIHNSLDFRNDSESGENRLADGDNTKYGGMITEKSVKYTRTSNKAMAFITVEDLYGPVEVVVFSNLYEKYGSRLQPDQVVAIQGRVSAREDEDAKIIANDIMFYEDIPKTNNQTLWIKIPAALSVELENITDILQNYRGETRVMIYDERVKRKYAANEAYWVSPGNELINDLQDLLGSEAVKMVEK
jgi:DNA polymerase-3 subunit alpha